MAESIHKKIARVRPPRVHITYDVETLGANKTVELPFVCGVLANLSGKPEKPLPPLKERDFIEVDRDSIDKFMEKIGPRLDFRVDDKVTGKPGSQLSVKLNFRSMEDFEPAKVASKVEKLRDLLDLRQKLSDLLTKMDGNDRLSERLHQIISDKELMDKARAETVTAGTREDTGSKQPSEEGSHE